MADYFDSMLMPLFNMSADCLCACHPAIGSFKGREYDRDECEHCGFWLTKLGEEELIRG